MDADQILVLHHGRIAERGTHIQLLEAQGEYARMWELQQQAAQAQAVLESAEIREEAL
jgi:ABC-type multidrug transport system fused ATPase/permease subunit